MIVLTGDCIVSGLGFTTRENFETVCRGTGGVQPHASHPGSRLDRKALDKAFSRLTPAPGAPSAGNDYTTFEKALIVSAAGALEQAAAQTGTTAQALASARDTAFFISSTKGNVELLAKPAGSYDPDRVGLWNSAGKCTQFFGNPNRPEVISNACISGVCAQIAAGRALQNGDCSVAVVVGAEVLSAFITSGFRSFKALSDAPCRPFDAQRCGLNLGEAAAAMVWVNTDTAKAADIVMVDGAIANDANHISGPSRTAEGLTNCLKSVLEHIDKKDIAFINAHGTATLYNDEMEALALHRCNLDGTPVNSLKGYFGHTLGAAGVLESILDAHALSEGVIIKSLGYENNGVTNKQNIVTSVQKTDRPLCIKMLSGFGGSNAVLVIGKGPVAAEAARKAALTPLEKIDITATVTIDNDDLTINNQEVNIEKGEHFLTELYRYLGDPYPKFYKMDHLCKTGWLAAGVLLKTAGLFNDKAKKDNAIILFNRNSSLDNDKQYQLTLDPQAYFPSPAVFVYTLANIVTGEIAIRHKIFGESSFYISESFDREHVLHCAALAFAHTPALRHILCGWVEYNRHKAEVYLMLVNKKSL